MALLSLHKIAQLFGDPMPLANVSGSVDGSNHMDLVEGEVVLLSNVPVEKGGNFVCREGVRKINNVDRTVQTIGWITPLGKFLALGSFYKKNAKGSTNPANVGIPTTSVNRADLLPEFFGKTVTIGAREEISVATFRPAVGEPTEKPGSWYKFTVA